MSSIARQILDKKAEPTTTQYNNNMESSTTVQEKEIPNRFKSGASAIGMAVATAAVTYAIAEHFHTQSLNAMKSGDLLSIRRAEISKRIFDRNMKYASGAISGAVSGALVGSVVPIVGTAVGAAAGATIGLIGSHITQSTNDRREMEQIQADIAIENMTINFNRGINSIVYNRR